MIRPQYIKEEWGFSRLERGKSRIICCIPQFPSSGQAGNGELIEFILYALDKGIRAFCFNYPGDYVETKLGTALQKWRGQQPEISIGICYEEVSGHDKESPSLGGTYLRKKLERTLKTIGIAKIDLLLLRDPHEIPVEYIGKVLDTIKEVKKAGIVETLGYGAYPLPDDDECLRSNVFDIVVGNHRLNACNLDAIKQDIPKLRQKGMLYYNSDILHSDLLGLKLEQYSRERPVLQTVGNKEINIAVMAAGIAMRHEINLQSLSIRFAISILESDRILIEPETIKTLHEYLESFEEGPLPEKIFNDLVDNILKFDRTS